MALVWLALALPYAADVDRLGSPVWRERDRATRRLTAAGVLALPAVLSGSSSSDPEVRDRCNRLAVGWLVRWEHAAAVELLTGRGWCGHDEARRWVGREDLIDQFARRYGLPGHSYGPWYCSDLCPAGRIQVLANWCRSCRRGGPLKWHQSWRDFLAPREALPMPRPRGT